MLTTQLHLPLSIFVCDVFQPSESVNIRNTGNVLKAYWKTFLLLTHQAVKSIGWGVFIIAELGESEGYHKCVFNVWSAAILLLSNKLQPIRASVRGKNSSVLWNRFKVEGQMKISIDIYIELTMFMNQNTPLLFFVRCMLQPALERNKLKGL